jgi:hypothetical protein
VREVDLNFHVGEPREIGRLLVHKVTVTSLVLRPDSLQ